MKHFMVVFYTASCLHLYSMQEGALCTEQDVIQENTISSILAAFQEQRLYPYQTIDVHDNTLLHSCVLEGKSETLKQLLPWYPFLTPNMHNKTPYKLAMDHFNNALRQKDFKKIEQLANILELFKKRQSDYSTTYNLITNDPGLKNLRDSKETKLQIIKNLLATNHGLEALALLDYWEKIHEDDPKHALSDDEHKELWFMAYALPRSFEYKKNVIKAINNLQKKTTCILM